MKLKTSCVVWFLTETYHEIVIASTNKFFLVMFERLIWLFCGVGHFLLHTNNVMLSVKLCEYYILNVSFSIGQTDDRCSLQNLQWETSWRNGYYLYRTCWPIYGLHINALLIFKIPNSPPALFMTSVWLFLCLFSWNVSLKVVHGLPLVMRCLF